MPIEGPRILSAPTKVQDYDDVGLSGRIRHYVAVTTGVAATAATAVGVAERPLMDVEVRGTACRTAILAATATSTAMPTSQGVRRAGRSAEIAHAQAGPAGSPKAGAGSVSHHEGPDVLSLLEANALATAALVMVLSSLLLPIKREKATIGLVEILSPTWSPVGGSVVDGRQLREALQRAYAPKMAGRQDSSCGRIGQE